MQYNFRLNQVVDPSSYVQVMMVRGYFSDWKQVVYFDFDKAMTDQLFLELVGQLEDGGLVLIAAV